MSKPVDSVEQVVKRGRKLGTLNKKTLQKMLALEQVRAMVAFDIIPITEALIKKAKDGDVNAAHELFNRAYGKSVQGLGFIDEKGKILPQPIMNIMLDTARDARHVASHVVHEALPPGAEGVALQGASSVEPIKE